MAPDTAFRQVLHTTSLSFPDQTTVADQTEHEAYRGGITIPAPTPKKQLNTHQYPIKG